MLLFNITDISVEKVVVNLNTSNVIIQPVAEQVLQVIIKFKYI